MERNKKGFCFPRIEWWLYKLTIVSLKMKKIVVAAIFDGTKNGKVWTNSTNCVKKDNHVISWKWEEGTDDSNKNIFHKNSLNPTYEISFC